MNVTHLYCSSCGKHHESRRLYNLCDCGKPLIVTYDLARAATLLKREVLSDRPPTLWRYAEVLPVDDPAIHVSLIEPI